MKYSLCKLILSATALGFALASHKAAAQPALPAPTPSSYLLELSQFATHTGLHAIDLASPHNGTGNVYVSAQSGEIFGYDSEGNSLGTFLDLSATTATTGFQAGSFVEGQNGAAFRGLMYFDFHPDFGVTGADGEGKIYTNFKSSSGFGSVDYQASGNGNQYVIAEWQVSASNPNLIDTSTYREVMRLGFAGSNPHAIGEIAFNPLAEPGDDDYGLLYAAIGDAGATGNVPPPTGYIQEIDNPFGKIIRINPLQDGVNSYSVPDNPFDNVIGAAPEVYALGFRDPQTFSFAKDNEGETALVTFDIGAEEREEVNLVRPGANHGWVRMEGTYELDPSRPVFDEANTTLVPPVLEYDHTTGGFAIAGGLVVSDPDDPTFREQVLFGDLVLGKIFHADFDDVLAAEAAGTQATIFESQVSFNENIGTFSEVRGGQSGNRGDARFGTDEAGNVYIVSKRSGTIYATGLVEASVLPDELVLMINREDGSVAIRNPDSDFVATIDAYELGSASGSLSKVGWNSLASQGTPSWQEAANTNNQGLAEFSPDTELALNLEPGSSSSLGMAYQLDVTAAMLAAGFGNEYEDVTFSYSDASSNQLIEANVEYVGEQRQNNLVLEINTNTGKVQLVNESPNSVTVDLYEITSAAGSLNSAFEGVTQNGTPVAGWQTGGNNSANGLAQFFPEPSDGYTIAGGEVFDLGFAFASESEARDLELLFHIIGGDDEGFAGFVRYLDAVAVLFGDADNDLVVAGSDLLAVTNNFGNTGSDDGLLLGDADDDGAVSGSDLLAVTNNFGSVLEASNVEQATSQTVPEPCSHVLAIFAGLLYAANYRRSALRAIS